MIEGKTSSFSISRAQMERELVLLGLSDKEARVYLAALEVGPSPVQEFAKQSGVNRATTYVMVESLVERGLMSSVDRQGKRMFVPEPPERLKQLVKRKEDRAHVARTALEKILPELALLVQESPDRPRVRFYEGVEGLEAMRADFFTGEKKHELLLISAADDYHRIAGMARRLPHAKRIERTRGFERCIFTSKRPAEELKRSLPAVDNIERRRVPEDAYPLSGEIAVYGEKIGMLSYHGKVMGVLVESAPIAQTATSLFNLAWETAKRFERFGE